MNKNRPLIITFTGDIFFLVALFWLAVLIFPNFLTRFGFYLEALPDFSERIVMILISMALLIASVGFLKLKKWGYWLMVIYNTLSLAFSIIFWWLNGKMYLSQYFVITIIELVFIIPTKEYFFKKAKT